MHLPPGASFLTAVSPGAGRIDQALTIAEESDFEVHKQPIPLQSITDGYSIASNNDLDITDGMTLTSVTGYRTSDETLITDNFGSPFVTPLGSPVSVPIFYANRTVEQEQFSQELRLGGTAGEKFADVGGLYYLDSQYYLFCGPGPLESGFGTLFVFGALATDFTTPQTTRAYAAFADGSYKITDAFTISAGIRYSYEKKSFDIDLIDAVTGWIILQYQVQEDIMVFCGWSRGFISGGFNGRAANIDVFDSQLLRRAPNWTLGIGPAYERPVFEKINFTATLDYS